jgi:thiol:disulfide interchange protein DsbA
MKRIIAWLLATLISSFALSSIGLAADPQTGRDFKPISPPLVTPKGKIEVIEFFSYGCNHCNDFHPLITQWAAKLPKDVTFRRIPVSFNRPEWARLSRIYFALEATGDLAKLDAAVFIAIHEQRINFKTDEAVVAWAASKGIDGKKFGDALASFSMQSKVQRADQEAAAARISGVPALAVDGKFLINNEAASNYEELLKLTDAMIAKARKEKSGN